MIKDVLGFVICLFVLEWVPKANAGLHNNNAA
jgi:hypothetical protein